MPLAEGEWASIVYRKGTYDGEKTGCSIVKTLFKVWKNIHKTFLLTKTDFLNSVIQKAVTCNFMISVFNVKVAANQVDMAMGGDQGGSIRFPSSACGIVGLKPTKGLVPYTGILPIEFTLDHAGPMARTVHDVALLLEVSCLTKW